MWLYVWPLAQGQLTAVCGSIWPNVILIQAFMVVLVTCKNEEDPIKNEGARVVTTLYSFFLRCSRAANSLVGGEMWT